MSWTVCRPRSAGALVAALALLAAVGCGSSGGSSNSEQAQRCQAACTAHCASGNSDADRQSCQTVCVGAIVGLSAACAQCVVAGISGCAQPTFASPGSSDCAPVCGAASDAGPGQ